MDHLESRSLYQTGGCSGKAEDRVGRAMAGSSSDAIMDGAPELNPGGIPQLFNLSPRSEEIGGDKTGGSRRPLRAVQSDPEVRQQRMAVQDGETQVLWISGSPRSVSPRTGDPRLVE